MAGFYRSKSFWWSFALTLLFFFSAFLSLHFEIAEYSYAVFLGAPIALAISAILIPSDSKGKAIGVALGSVVFFAVLLLLHWEGIVCILMALPIVAGAFFVGMLLGWMIKDITKNRKKNSSKLQVVLWPYLAMMAAIPIESALSMPEPLPNAVSTELVLPYSATEVYDAIKSVDTLIATKPFLMQLNLPVPQKCILEKEEVGGLRTCYFEGGTITERITALEPGRLLKMDVISYQLTGRKWLGFKEAIYIFEPIGDHTSKITRTTTYTSVLRPVAYWRPWEELGIQQEHEYVFDNLKRDLARLHPDRSTGAVATPQP